jgi:hypothetical protein
VVELEHHGISLPAVPARMLVEVVDEVRGPFECESLLVLARLVDVPLTVREVVLASLVLAARPAE